MVAVMWLQIRLLRGPRYVGKTAVRNKNEKKKIPTKQNKQNVSRVKKLLNNERQLVGSSDAVYKRFLAMTRRNSGTSS